MEDAAGHRTRVGAPTPVPGLCLTCTASLRDALSALPLTYARLVLAARHPRQPGLVEPVAGTRERPIPLAVNIEALARGMHDEVCWWAGTLAAILRVDWDARLVEHHTRPGAALARAAALLAGGLSAWLAIRDAPRLVWNPHGDGVTDTYHDGADGAATVLAAHHRAARLLGVVRLTHRMPVDCWRCRRRTLLRADGSDTITCAHCDYRTTLDDYHHVVHVLARTAA